MKRAASGEAILIANHGKPVGVCQESGNGEQKNETGAEVPPALPQVNLPLPSSTKFHPEFRFNIEVHLPSNGTEETYLNIFTALGRTLA